MEMMVKVSRGTKMDQIYLSKNRSGFPVGTYVLLKSVSVQKERQPLYFYHVGHLEPLKVRIIEDIFARIEKDLSPLENILITGSFLEKGFCFQDIDILLLSDTSYSSQALKKELEEILGVKIHIICLSFQELIQGLSIDPLYEMMLSRCVARKRLIYKKKRVFKRVLLDLQLLKSKPLIDAFEHFDGKEKWYLMRNFLSLSLFLQHKTVSPSTVESELKKIFGVGSTQVKNNMLEKKSFLPLYTKEYTKVFKQILRLKSHGAE